MSQLSQAFLSQPWQSVLSHFAQSFLSAHGLTAAVAAALSLSQQALFELPSAMSGAITRATTLMSLTRMFNEGPAVSLKGSPTVSPTTEAL